MKKTNPISQETSSSIEKIEDEIVMEVLKTYDKNPDWLTPELKKIVEKLFI